MMRRNMLSRLTIRNLALVDSLSIEFQKGLNVITGETGAGKSLLIGALRLLLGDRADKSMIRTGESSCGIEACFELARPQDVDAVLDELGMAPCEDGQLIIRRTITENSSKNWVNDSPVTLNVLKALGDVLVDMHGPYDHQSLLRTDAQMDILDAFGELGPARADYRKKYRVFQGLENRLRELANVDNSDLEEQIDLLTWRIKEIEDAKVSEEDEEETRQEHEQIANAQNILELAQTAAGGLTEGEYSAFEGLSAARRACSQLEKYIPEAANWAEELEGALRTAQEISAIIQETGSDISAGPDRMQFLEERVALYRSLKRKYAPTVSEILELLDTWKERLRDLQSRDEQRAEIEAERAAALVETEQAGLALSNRRQKAAVKLADAITAELRDLGFEHGLFEVQLMECDPTASGMDEIEFGFAPNAGESMRPLRMIASSGEISRVMLAVKAVLARHDRIPLLVFDEIDANVGGEIANAVGKKLAQVGKTHQLITITHLPQVAACGSTHFAVSKSVRNERTYTEINLLEDTARTEEVARMLGGKDLTNVTLQHAGELLANQKE
ncbi:DNA repair protein RecN [Tichowtungia aerotolerans]|uniref:DNA repair protein RecN n=1 Tax=Tichowtungia aerotolerans TaxID=2697043 RepID=A0A6P1ME86_9BACT|nr:DNA repair protein RecN [Tichowtungia aerotolerans]QHI70368.1 DNA repair protein RecN [Tichowtungia aerotolerans]